MSMLAPRGLSGPVAGLLAAAIGGTDPRWAARPELRRALRHAARAMGRAGLPAAAAALASPPDTDGRAGCLGASAYRLAAGYTRLAEAAALALAARP